jgi:sulfatase maturation enzyme AslB (radical SAM superfamily)
MITLQQAKDPALARERAESLVNAVRSNALYTLIVEPSSKCNLACTFCDLHSGRIDGTDALKGQMSEQTFSRIVDQLADMPFVLKELQYHGNGEPLLNKSLPDFVRYAKERGVAKKHRLTTNGTMLTPKNLAKVIDAGIDEIHVSLDTSDRASYSELKGCDLYEKVEANIDSAISYLENRTGCSLFIKYALPHANGDYGFTNEIANAVVDKYRDRVKNSKTVHLRGMPLVTLQDGKKERKKEFHTPCEIPFYSAFVKFDGKVSVCCADLFQDLAIGNVNETTLGEMMQGESLRHIRRCHLKGDLSQLPLCLYCGNRTSVDMVAIAGELQKYVG